MDGIKARLEPAKVQAEILKKYVGMYTRGEVILVEGQLFMQSGPRRFKMIPLSETYFVMEGMPNVRVEFILNESCEEYEAIGHFPDGRSEIFRRIEPKK